MTAQQTHGTGADGAPGTAGAGGTGPAVDLADLAGRLEGRLVTDPDILASHSTDEAVGVPAEGAVALVRARSTADVVETLRHAHAHGVPVVPQGARTGLSGAANAVPGAILLDVRGMDAVVGIDAANHTVTVQPGVINQDLKDVLRPHGLAYPPDPGSVAISSVGGNIATNAGGLCCVKYGVTRDYVLELTVVLADGTVTRLGRRTAKGVAGLDLCGLFVGSEGTLGVIVEAVLRVVPLGPDPLTAVATFPRERDAAAAVAAYMASEPRPSLMELMDRTTIGMLNELGDFGFDGSVGAIVIMQSDSPTSVADTEAFARIAGDNGAVDVAFSDNAADNDALIAARRNVQPSFEHFARAHGGGRLLEDVCVPLSRFTDFVDGLDEIRGRTGVVISLVAHAGDGNTHPSIFYDPADPASARAAQTAFDDVMQLGLDLGGTITGEHGVGYLKRGWLARELDDGARRLHREIKAAVDPAGILNPGKMLDAL
ncbi:FAD-binding oxidoreductase [Corynebacterium bovis]|uniref:FAD-binding oxidoreductase n=1 Tax=Corynebacterium bovis TaxID=36808 RepID=UPI003139837F